MTGPPTIRDEIIIMSRNDLSREQIKKMLAGRNAKFRKDGIEIRYSKVCEGNVMQYWKDGDPICEDCYIRHWRITPAQYYRITNTTGALEFDGSVMPPFMEDAYLCASCLKSREQQDIKFEEKERMKTQVVLLKLLGEPGKI